MSYTFEVAGKEYQLRLTTKAIIDLEKKIGCNPLMVFGRDGNQIPTITVMVAILAASLKPLNHGITDNDANDIFDNWLAEGHSIEEFIYIILEIYKVSGLVREAKN